MSTPPAGQFWLLTGEVPAGPYTVAQVHAELAAGRATWQTPACPVGGCTWHPLVKTPGLGPEPRQPAVRPPQGRPPAQLSATPAFLRPYPRPGLAPRSRPGRPGRPWPRLPEPAITSTGGRGSLGL